MELDASCSFSTGSGEMFPCENGTKDLSDSSSDIAVSDDDDLDSIGEFCFETARLAYKANSDYKNLLQSMVIWKSQLAQAKKDKTALLKLKEEVTENPLEFVEKLKRKEIKFPKAQKIAPLPVIDWSKYEVSGNKQFPRQQIKNLSSAKSFRRIGKASTGEIEHNAMNYNVPKLNQQWSEEEQRRLEALLLKYPPEEIETRRWEKIAYALGNRTPRQVASRVQKYFIKLMREGNPVPGRMPNKNYLTKNKMRQRMNGSQQTPAAPMDQDDFPYEEIEVSDEDDIHPELRNTPEYKELILVKKVLKRKMELSSSTQKDVR